VPPPAGLAASYSVEQQQLLLEERWASGTQALLGVFADQTTNWDANTVASEFVRDKVRRAVRDPTARDALVPGSYPIGTKRLILDTGYYEVFNQDNVELVDVRRNPIEQIIPTGVRTRERDIDLEVMVFALGFEAFTGALDEANITNGDGVSPSQLWSRGPQTYLGIMTRGFPNLFMMTGPGSPSVLANMMVGSVHHGDFITGLLVHMRARDLVSVEPRAEAQDGWVAHSADAAEHLIRRQVNNYMVHVNDDGSRVFIPYTGGFAEYLRRCAVEVGSDYAGFHFGHHAAPRVTAAARVIRQFTSDGEQQ
jgi:cation diffusion facilitator CzcD-associated flavoprotein CzcO